MAEATSVLPGSDFVRGASGLPIAKQLGLLIALAAAVAVGFGIVLWMRAPDYRPITGITSIYQANQVAEILTSAQIDFSIDETSGLIQVPKHRLYEARMKLAASDSLDGRQIGYELLDQEQGFGVSQFMEVTKHRRSLEGELARSIQTINSVQTARVLLATPKSTTFLRDRRIPTASVTITLVAGQNLSGTQVRGITNLVAGAVPELLAENVAVVDQTGKLLSDQDGDESLMQSERQLGYVSKLEAGLQAKIDNLLLPLVGRGRYTAQVTADVDFTWVEQTAEFYNPDLPALRSEETLTEQRTGDALAGGIPGALSNTPPVSGNNQAGDVAGGIDSSQPTRSKSQATRNYELDRTISHTRHAMGQLQRITVSVVVDDFSSVDAESGDETLQPWSENEITRLTASVKNAIGYSPARGDTVSVVNTKFFVPVVEEEIIEPGGIWTETWFVDLMRMAVGALVLLVLVIGLLRPMFRSLTQAGAAVGESAAAANAIPSLAAPGGSFQDELASLGSMGGGSALLPSGGTPYSSKVESVRGIVNENPARVAQVVKHWVSDNE